MKLLLLLAFEFIPVAVAVGVLVWWRWPWRPNPYQRLTGVDWSVRREILGKLERRLHGPR